ncbi:MAG: type IX secretion system sortase PorU, partial [Bacteroidaceae bacterium]|nr:type IX secretion system sortase PorU [Bacteroidaceae bacterium]
RRLLKMLYDRHVGTDAAPRYLLLMGDCAWDNRMVSTAWKKYNPDDYLLCYESENSLTSTSSYVMEDYFALMDDGEGGDLLKDKPDLGVGRFPVTTAEEAKVMVDKTIAYLEGNQAGSWRNLVCMLGDDGDANEHMKSCNDVAEMVKRNQKSIELRKVMWDAYDRVSTASSNGYPQVTKLLRKQMKDGAAVMNYMGHANTYALSHEFVLMKEDFADNKTDRLGLWVTAACDVMPFDGQVENTGETAVLTAGGGAMAFFGTARTVYASQNRAMNLNFMKYLFERDEKGRRNTIGDAICLSKNAIIASGSESIYKENKLQYALLGDPALVIGAPTNKVALDSINGKPVAETSQLKAGQKITLCGHITDERDTPLTDFTGVLTARFYDNEQTIVCRNNAQAPETFSFTDRTLIHFGQDSVRSGQFTLSFVVPVDINYSEETARAVFYAVDNAHRREASGYNEAFSFSGTSEEMKGDTLGPKIFAYLNTEDFQMGGTVNNTPYLVAKLEAESGISISGNGIGHDILLTIDDLASQTYTLNDYYVGEFGNYKKGTVAFSIPSLSDGRHRLTLRAWDVLNNTAATSLDFVVDASLEPNIARVYATQNPARSATTFIVNTNRPGSDCTVTIDIYDFKGTHLWTNTEHTSSDTGIFSMPWNLCTGGGSRLGTGIYLYRATVQCGRSRESTVAQKIVVINNK